MIEAKNKNWGEMVGEPHSHLLDAIKCADFIGSA